MCEILDEIIKQEREEAMLEIVHSLLINGIKSFAIIKNVTKLTQDEICNIANAMNIQLID